MKKAISILLGGLLLMPVISNAAETQKQLITKNRLIAGHVKTSWLWMLLSNQLLLVLLKR